MLKLTEEYKVKAVIELYRQTYAEITRYRDLGWKVTSLIVGMFIGIIAATKAPLLNDHKIAIKTLLIIYSIVIFVYGVWIIIFNHVKLVWNWNLRRECEHLLYFYSVGAYKETSLLPERWATERHQHYHGFKFVIPWSLTILFVFLYAIYSVFYM